MRLLIYSDLHQEFTGNGFTPKKAWLDACDVVVQTGDLNLGVKPVRWLKSLRRPVVYVTGNHEYYNPLLPSAMRLAAVHPLSLGWGSDQGRHPVTRFDFTIESLDRDILDEIGDAPVHILQNRSVVIGDVRFLGTTLWTDMEGVTDRHALALMMDFKRIWNGCHEMFTPRHWRDLHAEAFGWLVDRLEEPFAGKTVVVTHHAPSMRSVDPDDPDMIGYEPFYASSLDGLVRNADLWIHGHIHNPVDYTIGKCRVLSNPRGYPNDRARRRFRKDLIVEI